MGTLETLLQTRKKLGEEIQQSGNATWNVSEDVGQFLQQLVKERHAKSILEIGTSIGYSTLFLAEAARETGGHVTTIESHAERSDRAHQVFAEADLADVVTQIKGHAPEIFSVLNGPWDFLFLDATKYEHLSYIDALLPHLKSRVCVVADNCLSHAKAMAPYMAYMQTLPLFTHTLLPRGTGLFISTRD